ncbi:MAG TPA: hypothetical protein PK926_14025 [Spirochaetota bacterium]|nr:hypothetical protein [Spirochaetota bacterium]HPI90540.1 hypothetical protein [Spirochaetota bacterium]HPR49135.1 hypothetical protein [Spirochaetota bacterium]
MKEMEHVYFYLDDGDVFEAWSSGSVPHPHEEHVSHYVDDGEYFEAWSLMHEPKYKSSDTTDESGKFTGSLH